MTNPEQEIVFYYRNGCHLCEEMAAALHTNWPAIFEKLLWVDVDESVDLQERYGDLVPAVVLDGVLLCHFILDGDKIARCIGDAANPV